MRRGAAHTRCSPSYPWALTRSPSPCVAAAPWAYYGVAARPRSCAGAWRPGVPGGQGGGQAGQALLGSLQLQAVHRCVRAVGGVLGPLCLDAFVPCLAKGAEGGGLGC